MTGRPASTMNAEPPRRSGLTLVELLAATALAGLLLAALSGVLETLRTQRETLRRNHPVAPWQARARRQIRWDLAHARWMLVRPRELHLIGYAARGPDGAVGHRPARVVYVVRTLGGRSWLLRRESRLEDRSRSRGPRRPVLSGVTGIRVRPVDDPSRPRAGDPAPAAESGFVPVPGALRLILAGDEPGAPVLESLVFLHGRRDR